MIVNNSIELIGNTPVVKLSNIREESMAEIYIKLEGKNPGGSIKDRAALGMIEEAEKAGILKKRRSHNRAYKWKYRYSSDSDRCLERLQGNSCNA